MTQKEAVIRALENLGTKTSLKVLAHKAELYYGAPVAIQTCCNIRSIYRNQGEDCRTYETQTRRDMLPDDRISVAQLQANIAHFRDGGDPQVIVDYLEKFQEYSTPQIVHMLKLMCDIRQTV
jgi:hypothetical protein